LAGDGHGLSEIGSPSRIACQEKWSLETSKDYIVYSVLVDGKDGVIFWARDGCMAEA
jgi:hypothetical protein